MENHKTWQAFIQGGGGGTLHLRRIIRPGRLSSRGEGGTLHLRRIIRPGRLSSRGEWGGTSFEGNHKTWQGFIQEGGGGGGGGALHMRRIVRPRGHFI